MKNVELMRYARTPIALNVRVGDEVLLIADTNSDFEAVEALAAATFEVGGSPTIAVMTPRSYHMENPTRLIAEAMKRADLVVLTVTKALIHSGAAGEAMANGVRFLNLEEITADLLTMTKETPEDYEPLQRLGTSLRAMWTQGNAIRITTSAGTDLKGSVTGRPGYFVAGVAQPQAGVQLLSCAFPDGEVGVAPVEHTYNGVIVVDIAPLHTGIGLVNQPVRVEVREGKITDISGGTEAAALREYLRRFGDEGATTISEISVGINPRIALTGSKNDKKKAGTMHIAFGNNIDIGGTVASRLHFDCVVDSPTLTVDGRVVVQDGQVQPPWKD